jgi:hypothetical protein
MQLTISTFVSAEDKAKYAAKQSADQYPLDLPIQAFLLKQPRSRKSRQQPKMDPGVSKDESCFHLEDGNKHGEETPYQPDAAAERRLVRKLDRTILPWIMLLYLLSYIDR